ncbi:hypothetical protein [Thermomonas carbonis]|uniref:Uncharacterized protein n=1 Tax=Thermomonas carbonis TaxID=1463158 RepID=A0A7G9SS98_9GAMM|nr:hypothetical protein [Thermomonas carbonis]QNN70723.1 hypothetical protein H9L16_03685 [Thermomonas carbonis]GHC01866.1 hypothetical protein GCM10010080_14470 [Thermomonas carbonis]
MPEPTPTLLRTQGGTQVQVSDSSPQVTITSPAGVGIVIEDANIRISSPGCMIQISGGNITLTGAQVTVDAMILNARMIRCDTIVANTVVGSSYTPGAGNVW